MLNRILRSGAESLLNFAVDSLAIVGWDRGQYLLKRDLNGAVCLRLRYGPQDSIGVYTIIPRPKARDPASQSQPLMLFVFRVFLILQHLTLVRCRQRVPGTSVMEQNRRQNRGQTGRSPIYIRQKIGEYSVSVPGTRPNVYTLPVGTSPARS